MKKVICVFCIFIALLTFSGCYEGGELKDRLIIQAVGVDYENGEYKITLQALNTGKGGNGDFEYGTDIVTVKGKSIAKALSSVSSFTGLNPLYSQNRIIIFGKSTRENKIPEILDFFSREYTLRLNVTVAVSDVSAYEILKADSENESTGAAAFTGIIETGIENSVCVCSEVYRVINGFNEKTSACLIPVLSLKKDGMNGKNTVILDGTAVFKDENYVMTLSPDETAILNIINNSAGHTVFAFDIDKSPVCIDTVKIRTKRKVKFENGVYYFGADVKCRADIIEYEDGDNDSIDENAVENAGAKAEKYIASECEKLFEKLKKNKCDAVRFLRLSAISDPEVYLENEDEYERYFARSVFSAGVSVSIRRIGQNTVEKKVK